MQALVLNARSFSFTDKEGRYVEGMTATFIEPGAPVDRDGDRVGLPVMQISGPLDAFKAFAPPAHPDRGGGSHSASPPVPGVFEFRCAMRPDFKTQKPVLTLLEASPVSAVNIENFSKTLEKGKGAGS